MEKSISINRKQLPIKEYNGQRVVTFKDIDMVHSRPDGTAHRNFKANRNRFIEGVDYFGRNSSEAQKEFGIIAPNGLILMTESGYLMLVKSFTDDLAWMVQRELVNNYFRKKAHEPEQLTLETAEYHYFDKTYKGEPFITLADFEHFTGITCDMARHFVKVHCKAGKDYMILRKTDLQELRRENPGIGSRIKSLTILKKQAVKTLLKYYDRGNNMPECFSKRHALPEKCSNRSIEIERVSPWEKYKHLGTYNESIIDKLLSEHGIYLYGETIIPKEIAFKYFVPAAVHTVLDKMYKDRHLTSESVLIDTNNLDDSDFVHTIKGINRKGLEGMVSVHNILVAGDVKFYDKGKLPEEYASLY